MSGWLLPGYQAESMSSMCLMRPMRPMERPLPRKYDSRRTPQVPPRPFMPPPNSNHPSPAALDTESAEVLENIRGLLK